MPSTWITALKEWNSSKGEHGGVWCIPRKGTPEYDQVRKLMEPKAQASKGETISKEQFVANLLHKYLTNPGSVEAEKKGDSELWLSEGSKELKGNNSGYDPLHWRIYDSDTRIVNNSDYDLKTLFKKWVKANDLKLPTGHSPKSKSMPKKAYFLEKARAIKAAIGKGLKASYEEKRVDGFLQKSGEVKHSTEQYVNWEWNEKEVTPVNTEGRDWVELRKKIGGINFVVELAWAMPWKKGGDWDTHILIFSKDYPDISKIDSKKLIDIATKIIEDEYNE